MKNTEILETQDALLSFLDKQRKFLLKVALDKRGCPNCGTLVSQLDAAGVANIDDWILSKRDDERNYKCPACGRGLIWTVYFTAGYGWKLVHIELPQKGVTP